MGILQARPRFVVSIPLQDEQTYVQNLMLRPAGTTVVGDEGRLVEIHLASAVVAPQDVDEFVQGQG